MSLNRILFLTILTALFSFSYLWFNKQSIKVYAESDPTASWSVTQNLPNTLASAVVAGFNGRLYIFGGANINDFSSIYTPSFNQDFSISSWSLSNNNLPQTRYWSAMAQDGDRVYILGGASLNATGVYVDTVYSSKIHSSGDFANWEMFSSLPIKSSMGAAVIINNRIYYAGGFNNAGNIKKIYSTPIAPDGSLGEWIISGDMPEERFGFNMLAYKGNIIILGGYNGSYLSTAYKTKPDENGNISLWQETTPFPSPIYRASATIVGSQLLVVGGTSRSCSNCSFSTTSNIYYADLADDGGIGLWTLSTNTLPKPVHGGSMARVGNYLYLLGGFNSANGQYLNSTYYTKLNLETDLEIPLLKQTASSWGAKIYDSADQWFPSDPTIARWGCALTSAVMIFQYNGITKMPDGTSLNPDTLNMWLKEQPGGYINKGWVNWQILYRLSKLAKSKNPSFSYDALEYSRRSGYSASNITADLKNNIPTILEVPGHFIVAKGTQGSSFTINDPFYTRLLLSDYSNTALSMGKFTPSNSDGSYIELVVDDEVKILAKDFNGDNIGEGFTQQPLDEDGGNGKSGQPKYFYYIQKPLSGEYLVTLSSASTKQYVLQSFLFNKDGNLKMSNKTGILGASSSDNFTISFDKEKLDTSSTSQEYSFDSLISDLDLLYSEKLITNFGIYKVLREEARQAKKLLRIRFAARVIMRSFLQILDRNYNRTIEEQAYQILKPEAEHLFNSLN